MRKKEIISAGNGGQTAVHVQGDVRKWLWLEYIVSLGRSGYNKSLVFNSAIAIATYKLHWRKEMK